MCLSWSHAPIYIHLFHTLCSSSKFSTARELTAVVVVCDEGRGAALWHIVVKLLLHFQSICYRIQNSLHSIDSVTFHTLKTRHVPLVPNYCVLWWNTYRYNYLELWSKHDLEFFNVYKSFSSVMGHRQKKKSTQLWFVGTSKQGRSSSAWIILPLPSHLTRP